MEYSLKPSETPLKPNSKINFLWHEHDDTVKEEEEEGMLSLSLSLSHTHTHTHTQMTLQKVFVLSDSVSSIPHMARVQSLERFTLRMFLRLCS